MESIQESVLKTLDSSEKELYRFFSYILQDLWEMGASPEEIISLVKKHSAGFDKLKVLDLGCGKGAVSVKLSKELGCNCYGIDAVPEFVEYARQKAREFNVGNRCKFETGDIRERVKELSGFDIVVLGAIGPVFGDYYDTLTKLSGCINKNGFFIIDDGYINDNSDFSYPLILKESDLKNQIQKAEMELIDNVIIDSDEQRDVDEIIFKSIKKRCFELIEKYPDKQNIFFEYLKRQESENDIIENVITVAVLVVKKKRQGV
ncbi:MAG: class I SAM-dependent methyltransferase [Bacteroidales bacterium]|nr:class I SAM-dependent methyltransferase [Bacteroidales bacterium]MDD2426298.1 class I SAM-dependent methyltransferase [Bacteroidales bacterium]MDD3990380.1 class I SAM-dependent methyltransferase [Bacteroidales bacterium]